MPASTVIHIEHTEDIRGSGISGGGRKELARDIINALEAFTSGSKRAKTLVVYPNDNEALAQATGTITFAAAAAADTVTVNGVTLTANTDFSVAGDDTADAAAYVTAFNAQTNALIAGIVSASSSGAVVTLTATQSGRYGNCITLASSNGTRLAVSAARLTGGTGAIASRTAVTF